MMIIFTFKRNKEYEKMYINESLLTSPSCKIIINFFYFTNNKLYFLKYIISKAERVSIWT